jgi:hypothetical protein
LHKSLLFAATHGRARRPPDGNWLRRGDATSPARSPSRARSNNTAAPASRRNRTSSCLTCHPQAKGFGCLSTSLSAYWEGFLLGRLNHGESDGNSKPVRNARLEKWGSFALSPAVYCAGQHTLRPELPDLLLTVRSPDRGRGVAGQTLSKTTGRLLTKPGTATAHSAVSEI